VLPRRSNQGLARKRARLPTCSWAKARRTPMRVEVRKEPRQREKKTIKEKKEESATRKKKTAALVINPIRRSQDSIEKVREGKEIILLPRSHTCARPQTSRAWTVLEKKPRVPRARKRGTPPSPPRA